MRKKDRTSHFRFNKQERSGMFFLLALIVLLQVGYFYLKVYPAQVEQFIVIDTDLQEKMETLKSVKDTLNFYPFNPNFINDYKGYALGMSVDEIDRLHDYRAQGKYGNTTFHFQQVTEIGDSLLNKISPFFKFPEWTKEKATSSPLAKMNKEVASNFNKAIPVGDLNSVSSEELKIVRGIGDKLSVRIIKFQDRLGGFLEEDQLYHVYGLEKEAAGRVLAKFVLLSKPQITKINVNSASSDELA
ncbi:ComEA family DNA-binding protein [Sediminicola arcticus]|uniref:Helix-hairpin-helix domain-containing protein n=1 Tax=Sediminicola arcticus TaxID=1574308 RepID=A0ABV2SXI9_9FLAO